MRLWHPIIGYIYYYIIEVKCFLLALFQLKRIIRELYIRDNCHPLKASVVVLFQLPMWFSMSLALRNMAGALPIKEAGMLGSLEFMIDSCN